MGQLRLRPEEIFALDGIAVLRGVPTEEVLSEAVRLFVFTELSRPTPAELTPPPTDDDDPS